MEHMFRDTYSHIKCEKYSIDDLDTEHYSDDMHGNCDMNSRAWTKLYPISTTEIGLVSELKYGADKDREIKKPFKEIIESGCTAGEHLVLDFTEAGNPTDSESGAGVNVYFFITYVIHKDLFNTFRTVTVRARGFYVNYINPQRPMFPLKVIIQPKAVINKETGEISSVHYDTTIFRINRRCAYLIPGSEYVFSSDFDPIPRNILGNIARRLASGRNSYASFWGDSNIRLFYEYLEWSIRVDEVDASMGEYFGGKKLFTLVFKPFLFQKGFRRWKFNNIIPTDDILEMMSRLKFNIIVLWNVTTTPDVIESMLLGWSERGYSNKLLYLELSNITEEVEMGGSGKHMRSIQLSKQSCEYVHMLLECGTIVIVNGFQYTLDGESADGFGRRGLERVQLPQNATAPQAYDNWRVLETMGIKFVP